MEKCGQAGKAVKETLRRKIRSYIQEQIAAGVYRAGDRIVETQLAKELNVSQAPVREAILELGAMGLLEERPYSGTFVRKLTPADIEDIYNTRALIDEYAARRAARNITDRELDAMERLLRRMDRAADTAAFVEMDMEFHAMVIDAAGSPALKRMWEGLRLVEWTQLSASATKSTLPELARQHRIFYDLLRSRAESAAGAYMYLHIKNFGDELARRLSAQEENADGGPGGPCRTEEQGGA